MTTPTEWPAVGERVAVYGSAYQHVKIVTVERCTPKQIVIEGDRRFRTDTLREVGGGDQLLPLTDPRVTSVLARNQMAALRYALHQLLEANPVSAETVLDRFDQAARLISIARTELLGERPEA